MRKVFSSLLVVVIFFMTVGLISADLTTGLVAYYPFNGNADDQSGNEHNGTVDGATLVADRFGHINSAYRFDGNDKISIPDDPSLHLQSLTLSAWVKPAVDMADGQQRVILSKEKQGTAGGYYLAYTRNADKVGAVNFKIMSQGGPATGYHSTFFVTDLAAGQWYHIVGTYDGTSRKLYIDGVLKKAITETITLFHDSEPIQIGVQAPGQGGFWNGLIDEVRIYDRALTEDEIQQLYHEGEYKIYLPMMLRTTISAYPTNGLVAAYLFSGDTNDSSGNGYHITSGSGPVLVTDRFGSPNSAYSFDGNDDYFYASTLPAVGRDDGLVTWSAWFKTSDPNDSPIGPIFDIVGAGGVYIQDKIVKGHMELGYDDRPSISTSAFYNDGKWHHVAFSYNGLTLKLYVDGVLIGSVDDGDPIDYDGASGSGFSIGRNLWQPYFFKGEIDDVLVYERELTAQEVSELSAWR